MPAASQGRPESSTADHALESAMIDAEFAAQSNTGEMELPVMARGPSAAEAQRYDTRPLTHVPLEQNFDNTLRLPRLSDAVDARRGRLAVRYKAVCAAYKVLANLSMSSSDRKEVIELFTAYEAGLRAAVPPVEPTVKRDADQLHDALPAASIEEHERALAKIEDRLIALDEGVSEHEFRANVSKAKQPAKVVLRYARVLASRRFNIGFRRDRFEYLAVELLTLQGENKRLTLLSREQAQPVLHHLLAGLPQVAAPEERGPATAHLLEALERLQSISSAKDFFEEEFYLDLHGYKISMRDQVTCPEFLYLSAALHVELHNRMLAWASSGNPSWQTLRQQLQAQQSAAEDVFANFRKPRSTPAAKASPRPAPAPAAAKEAQPQPVPAARKKKKRKAAVKETGLDATQRAAWLKVGALALVIVLSGSALLFQSGAVEIGTPLVVLDEAKLHEFSPLLVRGTIDRRQHRLTAWLSRSDWSRLSKQQRQAAAAELSAQLKEKGLQHAQVLAYKSPVMQIEFLTVVNVDEAGASP